MDKYKLKYEIDRRGETVKGLCNHLGISTSTFYRRCNDISGGFRVWEMREIVDFLHLESPESIFFPDWRKTTA